MLYYPLFNNFQNNDQVVWFAFFPTAVINLIDVQAGPAWEDPLLRQVILGSEVAVWWGNRTAGDAASAVSSWSPGSFG